jgi:hypothetical protein
MKDKYLDWKKTINSIKAALIYIYFLSFRIFLI